MNNYDVYINNINNIFNILDTLEKDMQLEENQSYIDNLKQKKQTIIEFSNIIQSIENNIEQQTGANVQ